MYMADDDYLMNYYGIDAGMLESYIFASSDDAARADTVILMQVKEEGNVKAIQDALQVVLSQLGAEMENYIPVQYEVVKTSQVRSEGTCAWLVISPDAATIEGVIQGDIL